MSPSSFSSSSGPVSASRSWRFSSEIWRVAAVIVRSGRSARPAISQPSRTAPRAMIPSASIDTVSSERSCWLCVSSATLWAKRTLGTSAPGGTSNGCRASLPIRTVVLVRPAAPSLNTACTLALPPDCRAARP